MGGSDGSSGGTTKMETAIVTSLEFLDELNDVTPVKDKASANYWDEFLIMREPTTPGLVDDYTDIRAMIEDIVDDGYTNLTVGLGACLADFQAVGTDPNLFSKAVIFLSDGRETRGLPYFNTGHDIAVALGALGVKIFSIGLGNNVGEAEMDDMAKSGAPGGMFFEGVDQATLPAIFAAILESITIALAPSDVDITEITEPYIIDEPPFSPNAPDNTSGSNTFEWEDVSNKLNPPDDYLTEDESYVITFVAKADQCGTDLPVDAAGAEVNYIDEDNIPRVVTIPPGSITVLCEDTCEECVHIGKVWCVKAGDHDDECVFENEVDGTCIATSETNPNCDFTNTCQACAALDGYVWCLDVNGDGDCVDRDLSDGCAYVVDTQHECDLEPLTDCGDCIELDGSWCYRLSPAEGECVPDGDSPPADCNDVIEVDTECDPDVPINCQDCLDLFNTVWCVLPGDTDDICLDSSDTCSGIAITDCGAPNMCVECVARDEYEWCVVDDTGSCVLEGTEACDYVIEDAALLWCVLPDENDDLCLASAADCIINYSGVPIEDCGAPDMCEACIARDEYEWCFVGDTGSCVLENSVNCDYVIEDAALCDEDPDTCEGCLALGNTWCVRAGQLDECRAPGESVSDCIVEPSVPADTCNPNPNCDICVAWDDYVYCLDENGVGECVLETLSGDCSYVVETQDECLLEPLDDCGDCIELDGSWCFRLPPAEGECVPDGELPPPDCNSIITDDEDCDQGVPEDCDACLRLEGTVWCVGEGLDDQCTSRTQCAILQGTPYVECTPPDCCPLCLDWDDHFWCVNDGTGECRESPTSDECDYIVRDIDECDIGSGAATCDVCVDVGGTWCLRLDGDDECLFPGDDDTGCNGLLSVGECDDTYDTCDDCFTLVDTVWCYTCLGGECRDTRDRDGCDEVVLSDAGCIDVPPETECDECTALGWYYCVRLFGDSECVQPGQQCDCDLVVKTPGDCDDVPEFPEVCEDCLAADYTWCETPFGYLCVGDVDYCVIIGGLPVTEPEDCPRGNPTLPCPKCVNNGYLFCARGEDEESYCTDSELECL
ncbi:hypothetical protein KIPB_001968, partial [Kipferlia bialata]|eukprot:g1968.t1